jgi:hypothetical protein
MRYVERCFLLVSASIPSAGAGDIGKQGGSVGGAEGKSEQVEEEPLDYEPSPVREKDKEKTPPRDDDVYSSRNFEAGNRLSIATTDAPLCPWVEIWCPILKNTQSST